MCIYVYFIKPSWAAGKWAFEDICKFPGQTGGQECQSYRGEESDYTRINPPQKVKVIIQIFKVKVKVKEFIKSDLYLDSDLCPPHHYFIFDARNNRLQTIYFCFTLPSPYFSFLPFHWPSLQKDDSDYQEAKTPNNKNNVFLLKKLHYKCRPDCIICSHKLGFG